MLESMSLGRYPWVVGMNMNALLAALLIAASFSWHAHAAPLVPGDGMSEAGSGASADSSAQATAPLPSTAIGTAMRTTRSVEMLLDMQGKSAGLDFSAGSRALDKSAHSEGTGAAREGVGSVATTPERDPRGGLFGSGATPIPPVRAGADPAAAWRPAEGNGTGDPARASGVGAQGTQWDQRVIFPSALVAWVRENRGAVVASAIGLLALLWGGSIAMGQRRR